MSDQQELFRDQGTFGFVPPDPDLAPPAEAGVPETKEAVMTEGPLKQLVDSNFLRYASYVIRDRAIPDLDDGLKPVQRRILFSLHQNDDGKFIKVANIVGYTMQFHPHGDASIGDALVTLANKQYMIEGQGNFGNVFTGDPAAAPRYIECRLTELARTELFQDDLTDFVPTYDGRREEPVSLPARIPMLLMLGADGIAVGLSTRILPHNFCELIEAQIAILQKKPFQVFPDFPQAGLMDVREYDDGRGLVRVRARIEKRDASTLVLREIPYGTNTDSLIASIEEAARKGKVKVKVINDFTAAAVEIEIQLQPEEDADRAIEALYAFSQCQVQLSSRIMVIRDRKPVEMDVTAILKHNTERLTEILRKELSLERRQLGAELHRKTLVEIFIEQKVYERIKECRSQEEVTEAVRSGLEPFRDRLSADITGKDIEMLLEIPIRRISFFDLDKNRRDMEQLRAKLAEVEGDLGAVVPYAIRYLRTLLRKHGEGYARRTAIVEFAAVEMRQLTAQELTIGYDREKGYMGYDIKGDVLLQCSSYDKLMLFWKDGRYKVVAPPEKLFVDSTLIYCAIADRERVITAVYTEDFFTYIKKFPVGGTILNKEYRFAPKGVEVVLFSDAQPETIFVRYFVDASQRIKQQEFATAPLPVRDAKARGIMLTSKKIHTLFAAAPEDWNRKENGPKGRFMDFG